MTKADFRNQYLRLCNGFQMDKLATDERLQALYETLGHYEASEMVAAVDALLGDNRMPTTERIHSALERAQDAAGRRRKASDDTWAKGFASSPPESILDRSMSSWEFEGCKLYRAACQRAWENDISPEETSFVVAELAKIYEFLWEEVDALWAMGDRWRNAQGYCLGGYPVVHKLKDPPVCTYRSMLEGQTIPDAPPDEL